MSSLAHHGVKGQKWGVRRYQNLDGTRTALGKKHYSVEAADIESTRKDIKNIVKKFSKKDKKMFFDRHFWNESYDKTDAQVAKRFVIKEGRDIVAFIDAQTSRHDSDLNMVIGTTQCARGKGYASILSKKMVDWYESEGYKDYGQLEWNAYNENVGSRKAAEKAGFKQVSGDYEESNYLYDKKAKKELNKLSSAFNKKNAVKSEVEERINSDFEKTLMGKFSPITRFHPDGRTYWDIDNPHYNSQGRTKANLIDSYAEYWAKKKHGQDIKEYTETANDFTRAYAEYNKKRNKVKHSSIGGNMNYIYGNTLVLGDSSYLEHHGIKNQKWGVRRFQNPDGSLTAAGRIRYGVTGAAKAAFKVGKKLGSATASAAKAGVKKAKDNAYAKKKEKASQTREGVLKNKKMFTNEELERLEKRFKIEDDMRNAGLRHGQEIAKTISAYSDAAVKTMNALQTGGKAVKAISDGLSALKDYKEKLDIGKKASDAGTKAKTSEKTSNNPPNDDNPPNDGGGGGSKKQVENEAKRQDAQEAIYTKRKADLDSRESDLKQREDYVNTRYDALLKVSKQRQSEQDARDEDLNRRDKAASEREEKLKSAAKDAVEVMNKLKERKDNLDRREADLNNIADALDSEIGYRIDTISELRKTIHDDDDSSKKKKNAKHSAIGEEMYTDHLEHHGIKGQKWGVRRFQNADGSLTDKGRKHYQKKLALEERKLTAANASRGQYERVRTPMSVGMGILGAIAGAMVGVPAGPAGIAAGAAVVSSIAASSNYAAYTVAGIVAGQGAKRNIKKIAKYKEALAQDAFEIQNGVLIYGSGQSGKLPTSELTRYAKSTVGQLKSEAKAELARRARENALTSMGSDYARATARVTTTSSTTNTTDAHNEKLARDRRDKRKQAARANATAKKNRLAGSGRKKYASGQTSSIGRVGSGRGKTSTRR